MEKWLDAHKYRLLAVWLILFSVSVAGDFKRGAAYVVKIYSVRDDLRDYKNENKKLYEEFYNRFQNHSHRYHDGRIK